MKTVLRLLVLLATVPWPAGLSAAGMFPEVQSVVPAPGVVSALTETTVTFTKPVSGVGATDLLVGGNPAVSVSGSGAVYTFILERQPAYGPVRMSWDPGHGIFDLDLVPHHFDEKAAAATWEYELVDSLPPLVSSLTPTAGVTVRRLTQIEVIFSEPVLNVDAGDLFINGHPASEVSVSGPGRYLFQFGQPAAGEVQVSWSPAQGIRDFAAPPNALAGAGWTYHLDPGFGLPSIRINEFVASNTEGLMDENHEPEDWIELYNYGITSVDLAGFALTDDAEDPGKWTFPSLSLEAGHFLVVFASGKDRKNPTGTNRLHTNFKLNPAGEYLGLFNTESPRVVLTEFSPRFPEQRNDYAYGYFNDAVLKYFSVPTPGAENGREEISGTMPPPHFNVARGFFEAPFELILTAPILGATLRYTTDGKEPTGTTGLEYTQPIPVTNTTLVRAAAFRADRLPSVTVTHSYIFPDQVLLQPNQPEGFPVGPTVMAGFPSDYEMDPEIVTNALYRDSLKSALKALPVLSIVCASNDMFGPVSGIYTHPTARGPAWEKPCSVEFILTNGASGFQVNAGIQVQGNAARDPQKQPKHPFRLVFKGDYGPARLSYRVFPDSPVENFDTLVLRADYNFSWLHWSSDQRPRGQRTRDAWMKDSLRAMGGLASHNRYVHLYLNGLYWGIYDPSERPDAAFAASYLGGEKEEYDSINEPNTNGGQAVDGTMTAYNTMNGIGSLGDVNRYNLLKQYLDVTQFIDYMLLHFYAGHQDWGNDKNWYAVRRREAGAGFKYVPWDGENILDVDVNFNRVADLDVPSGLHTKLLASSQYKADFADRVQKHLFHDGALTTSAVSARWMKRAAEVDLPIIAESARWGDYRRDVHAYSSGPYELYTRDVHWLAEQSRLLNQYFPKRTGIVLNQLRSAGLYPSLAAPVFNQQGGRVARGFGLTMAATNTIYYTTNGADPRVYGSGALAPEALIYTETIVLAQSALVKARAFAANKWSALNEASFSVGALGVPIRITEIMYNPVGGDAYEFVELQNIGAVAIDLGYYSLDGLGFVFAPHTVVPPGAVIVLGSDKSPGNWTMRYPGVAAAGRFSGALANGGEKIAIKDPAGRTVYSVEYRDSGGWPVAADGSGYSLEMTDPFGDPNDPALWRASTVSNGTPGRATAPSPLPAEVVLNEVMAENVAAVRNGTSYPDWVELYNRGSQPVDLAGWSLSDDGRPGKFVFPPGARLPAGGYGVVWCDDLPTTETEWHAGFSLDRQGESIFLFDASAHRIDAVSFGPQVPDRSLGRVNSQWVLTSPTPRAANQPALLAASANLVINEWLASSAPGGADWIELYNRSSDRPVALPGLYLGTSNATFLITAPSFVPAGGFIQLWADEKPGPDHLDFKLSAAGGIIFLYDETGAELDRVDYAPQIQELAQGRYPDGAMVITNFPASASPGASNYLLPYQGPVLNEMLAVNPAAMTNGLGRTAGWVELFNPNEAPFDLSGMGLSNRANEPSPWSFPAGLSLPGQGYLVVWFDRERPASAGLDAFLNTGRSLSDKGGVVQLLDRLGRSVDAIEYGFQMPGVSIGLARGQWGLLDIPSPGAANSAARALGSPARLRFNEWMASPQQGADWFEVYNGASQPVELTGLYLSDDPSSPARTQFRIGPLSFLGPGGLALWIADGGAGAGPDHVNFSLDAEGEALCLSSARLGMIDAVYFGRQAEGISQGRLPDGAAAVVSFFATSTPGESNYLPLPNVEISEILTRAAAPLENAIELSNLTALPVATGGWYLSDSETDLRKFRIPTATLLPAYGFTVFYENQFNGGFGSGVPFRWEGSSEGAVYLSQADAEGNLTGYRSQLRFGAAERGVSFGIYQSSLGRVCSPQSGRTLGVDDPRSLIEFRFGRGRTNAYPKVGPVVVNELMYHPPDAAGADNTGDEFIELFNLSANAVPLTDPLHPGHSWRLRGGVQFDFPRDALLLPRGFLLVVSFDPVADVAALVAFRSKHRLLSSVPVHGPYRGKLDNGGEEVELLRPDEPPAAGSDERYPAYIVVDAVRYGDATPWPLAADGGGASLQRRNPRAYGNDPVNWKAEAPTPGRANVAGSTFADGDADGLPDDWEAAHGLNPADGADALLDLDQDGVSSSDEYHDGTDPQQPLSLLLHPQFNVQPEDQLVPVGRNVAFAVVAQGTAPLTYQWWFNGRPLAAEMQSSLGLTNVQPAEAGEYQVVAMNAAGFALSQKAHLTVKPLPRITRQPQNLVVTNGTNVSFTVEATGSGPLTYQWRFNGVHLPEKTGPTLSLSDVQMINSGSFTVSVADEFGSVISYPALLTVLAQPTIIRPPLSQTALAGSTVIFSVSTVGSQPMGYRWLRDGVVVALFSVGRSTLTVTNVQLAQAGTYSVLITNVANTFPGVRSVGGRLTVLADDDGDGLPDDWEAANGLDSHDRADALLDRDGDGMSNRDEYTAGTDPGDPRSFLKVDQIRSGRDGVQIEFTAVSNRAYSVQFKSSLALGPWSTLLDFSPRLTNRVERVLDPVPAAAARVYRLAIPQNPGP